MHRGLLFAFDGFASLGMLWWGVLGGIPIMIHLLHKRKYRETSWAAMRFLIEAARKNSRRIRIEQLILLMVRVLILLLLVSALAQPYLKSFGTFYRADVPIHRILVIDSSFSMEYRGGGASRFENAINIAQQILNDTRQGDALNLVRIGSMSPRVIVRKPSFQKSEVLREIESLTQSHERGDLAPTLTEIVSLLEQAPELEQKEVIFLSDFQRSCWAPPASEQRAKILTLLRKINTKAEIQMIDVATASAPNIAIVDFQAADPYIAINKPITLTAEIENFTPTAVKSQTVQFWVDRRLVQTQQVTVPAGESVPVEFQHTFTKAGEHRLEVRTPGDALEIDNHRYLSLPVTEALKVLLVNGEPGSRPSDRGTFYVEKALRPKTSSQPWAGVTEPTTISEGELSSARLSDYDCLMLCNVARVTPQDASHLESFVKAGGGLIICLGENVEPSNYNELLLKSGVLPIKLKAPIGDAETPNPENLFWFDPAPDDLKHPIIQKYEGNPGTGLESTFAFKYFPSELPPNSPARVVLKFRSGGDPAIVEAPFGQGRVVVYTTSVDSRWGAWPLQPQTSFLPILHESVKFVVAGQWSDRQKEMGEPISRQLRAFNVIATIERPDQKKDTKRVVEQEGTSRLDYTQTNLSGIYEIQMSPPVNATYWYAVNVDPRESSLQHVGEEELQNDLLTGVEFQYLTQWQDGPRLSSSDGSERGGLTRWLLTAVLCLVLVEVLMAWRFRYGLALLCGFIVLAVITQLSTTNLPWVIGGAICLGIALLLWQRQRTPKPMES